MRPVTSMSSLPIITIRKSPSCSVECRGVGRKPLPPRETPAIRIVPVDVERVAGLPTRCAGTGTRTRRSSPPPRLSRTSLSVVQEHQLDLLDPPRRGRHRRDVEPSVDLRAARIEDPRDDLGHVVVLQRHSRRHDVGVVAAGDRDERVGLADAGLFEHVAIEAQSHDPTGMVAWRIVVERLRALVDDGDIVAGLHRARATTPSRHDRNP